LLTAPAPWPDVDRPRRAVVSSFGISGTNAHVVLEQASAQPATAPVATAPVTAPVGTPVLSDAAGTPVPPDSAGSASETATGKRTAGIVLPWVLSGHNDAALRAQAQRVHGHVAVHGELDGADVGYSLAATRAALAQRAVVLAEDHAGFLRGLAAVADGGPLPDGEPVAEVVRGSAGPRGGTVLVFPGQGSQWAGMAVGLLDSSPTFAARIAECADALAPHVDWSLLDVLRAGGEPALLDRVDVVQPVLFAVMVSLASLWADHGVRPSAVVGHSQGEIAAAYVAGALSLPDAARVVALRARALAALSGRGGMVSVALSPEEVARRTPHWGERAWLAAVNGPRSVVVSGAPETLAALVADCTAADVRTRLLPVDYASHSPHVQDVQAELLEELAGISPRPAEIPFYSTVTGAPVGTATMDAGYWYRNLRQTVRFEPAIRALLRDGHTTFIESSPHPVLTMGIEETAADVGVDVLAIGSLRRDDGGRRRFLAALAEAHVRGVRVDWQAAFDGGDARRVDLPTYAFRRRRYWLGDGQAPGGHNAPAAGAGPAEERFWDAVQRLDLAALTATLDVDGEQPLRAVLPALSAWRRRQADSAAIRDWRYRVTWKPLVDAPAVALPGTWLLVAPADPADPGLVSACAAALSDRGAQVVRVEPTAADRDRGALARLLRESLPPQAVVGGVLSLLAVDERPLPDLPGVSGGLAATLALGQALGDIAVEAPLWCVTSGAVSVAPSDRLRSAAQAQVWGLGRVIGLEHPQRWGGLVDLPEVVDGRALARLAAVLGGAGGTDGAGGQSGAGGASGEDEVAVRPAGTFARRLVRASAPAPAERSWRPRDTVVVTGGTGALGAHAARWLARGGAEHLVLTSRRGGDAPGASDLRAELESLGARVTIATCDVADRGAVDALLDR
ncbi:acyltransferase domain-containing protein, partial [Candidatus Protofrankia californiensis]|uniref:acyltransferase domain-containing protein n=1 Tax=Candidatus Protofrankia californiensis TaxID=1839754 RepID=UPI0013EA7EC3